MREGQSEEALHRSTTTKHPNDCIVSSGDRGMKLSNKLEAKLRRAEDRASKLVEEVVGEMVG